MKCNNKERRKQEVDDSRAGHEQCNLTLGVKHEHGCSESKLFQRCRQHEETIAPDVTGDEQECELPGERNTNETVEVLWMGERWGKVSAQLRFHEVLRKQRDNAINSGDEEDSLGEVTLCGH